MGPFTAAERALFAQLGVDPAQLVTPVKPAPASASASTTASASASASAPAYTPAHVNAVNVIARWWRRRVEARNNNSVVPATQPALSLNPASQPALSLNLQPALQPPLLSTPFASTLQALQEIRRKRMELQSQLLDAAVPVPAPAPAAAALAPAPALIPIPGLPDGGLEPPRRSRRRSSISADVLKELGHAAATELNELAADEPATGGAPACAAPAAPLSEAASVRAGGVARGQSFWAGHGSWTGLAPGLEGSVLGRPRVLNRACAWARGQRFGQATGLGQGFLSRVGVVAVPKASAPPKALPKAQAQGPSPTRSPVRNTRNSETQAPLPCPAN